MQILIEYESSWRNSFLDGSNNQELPKNGRKFIGSIKELKQKGNFLKREITLDTVMGILNRLIGDQRKLYQARNDINYYFRDVEGRITFKDLTDKQVQTNEVVYIRNISGSEDQNSFTGAIKTNDVIFNSGYSSELWGVLALNFEELLSYIVNNNKVEKIIELDPIVICNRFEELRKFKPVENSEIIKNAIEILDKQFPDTNFFNKKGEVVPSTIYCSAFYLQIKRLTERFDISSALTKSGNISGISKRIFTKKDFMERFVTGGKKKVWGNPYFRKEKVKGEDEVVSMLTKASGNLEIIIDVDREKAKEFKELIENAGVSSFYLGKKGLAYVASIDTREVGVHG